MIIIYDKEDYKDGDSSVPFLDRDLFYIRHERTAAGDKTETQKWVDNNNYVPDPNGDDKVYKHYVPYNEIFKVINDRVVKSNSRRQFIEWLENVAANKLGIENRSITGRQQISRFDYDEAADHYVSSICDWQENIFRGASDGDGGGMKKDTPKDSDLAKKVRAAEEKLFAALAT
ncbi:hypothetical protein AAL_04247 [Moelleriella libera RCEF 2490]|uniref:Uncharacterized protein n=1 Tax=Moelleriella libera RCEF 2490 TaxID=1081109 RepID=A0A168BZK5_9HYPO|nr:hypothetical protein AAL_04247 [Moelleriella libera RCEF 2490]